MLELHTTNVTFQGQSCFGLEAVGFGDIKKFNVIVGRNNSGKSRLLETLALLTAPKFSDTGWDFTWDLVLAEPELRELFPENFQIANIANPWGMIGRHLIGTRVTFTAPKGGKPVTVSLNSNLSEDRQAVAYNILSHRARDISKPPLAGYDVLRVNSERDITPEPDSPIVEVAASGAGSTITIVNYLTRDNLPRDTIRVDLRNALNQVLGDDGNVDEIVPQRLSSGAWEIFLSEENKGLIPLSRSGSGLKTIILVLLAFIVQATANGSARNGFAFVFEELENNLHPALLKRLLKFIVSSCSVQNRLCFIATHSPVVLDFFSDRDDAQVLGISHNGQSASVKVLDTHFARFEAIAELGAKPSDLLQANGVLWVEGPSDRVYLTAWIELLSEGRFQEGKHYQCAFYGGALLGNVEFVDPDFHDKDKFNLLRVNSNIFVVCDSDRRSKHGPLKQRVARVVNEVVLIPNSGIWVTAAKEIENYAPADAIQGFTGLSDVRAPGQYEPFLPSKGVKEGTSYVESVLKRRSIDKVEFGVGICRHLNRDSLQGRFDLVEGVGNIINAIQKWNE